jgi:hypothetical protein
MPLFVIPESITFNKSPAEWAVVQMIKFAYVPFGFVDIEAVFIGIMYFATIIASFEPLTAKSPHFRFLLRHSFISLSSTVRDNWVVTESTFMGA